MLFHLLFTTSTATFFCAHSADDTSLEQLSRFGQVVTQPQPEEQLDWYHVKAQFKREKFLDDYNKEYGAALGRVSADAAKLSDSCWKALFFLKDHYKSCDTLNYGFTYLNMAKLLLTKQEYPTAYISQYHKKKFHQDLRDIIGGNVIPNCPKAGKLLKWTRIYEGMLFLDYVKQFPETKKRKRCIADAYYEFCEAMKLKATKTTYLLAAEVILDFGYVPVGMSQAAAKALAEDYREKAFEKIKKAARKNQNKQQQQKATIVETHARPTYMPEVKEEWNLPVQQPVNEGWSSHSSGRSPDAEGEGEVPDVFMSNEGEFLGVFMSGGEEAPDVFMSDEGEAPDVFISGEEETPDVSPPLVRPPLERDLLENFDYRNLVIPQRQNDAGLLIRNKPQNTVGGLQEAYTIDNKRFRRQNVSGSGMRCFFNAVGLNPDGQNYLLGFSKDDPVMRYMIANEIVSAADNPEQIPAQVKEAINYSLYEMQRTTLDRLDEQRGDLLSRQNSNPELTNPRLLPQIYQQLGQRDEDYLEQLRQRALRLESYKAFIKYHIGNEQMMVALSDLRANGNANFTSIDAIAYANDIGIKIYQPSPDGTLRLAHEYIPQNAKEVAYVYHEGVHFQTFVPVAADEELGDPSLTDVDQVMDVDQEESEEGDDLSQDESILSKMPNNEELRRLYPDIETNANHREHAADLVRKIIYAHKGMGMKSHVELGEVFDLDPRRVSEILLANNIRAKYSLSEENIDDLAHSYLELYAEIQKETVTYTDIGKEFAKKLNVPVKTITHYFSVSFREGQKDETSSLIKTQSPKVVGMYKKGKDFQTIKEETGLSIESIIKIIHKNVSPENYIKSINLQVKKKALSEADKKELIIKTFNAQKQGNPGKAPSISSVHKALESKGIGYKTVDRILKRAGLVQTNIKAKHLTKDQKEKIKEDFARINPPQGEIMATYKNLARKHKATFVQVKDLLKNRTYESQRKLDIQKNYDAVVVAYYDLTPEQRKLPAPHIAEVVDLQNAAINDILEKAGLYKWNGKTGKHAANLLADDQISDDDAPPQRVKRSFSEFKKDSVEEDSQDQSKKDPSSGASLPKMRKL